MKKQDEVMQWEGFGNGFGKWPSSCRIRLYENDDMQIVVATQAPDDPGTSVTNCVEAVAMMAIAKYGLDPKKFVFIQHKPDKDEGLFGKKKDEIFCTVTFDVEIRKSAIDPIGKNVRIVLVSPVWKPMKRAHVESLIGEALDA